MALPRDRRITRRPDFLEVRERGKSIPGKYIILGVLPGAPGTRPVAGFTLTKRTGNAVTRNLVRRRLRMIVREALAEISAPYFIVTVARHTAARADYDALRHEWRKLAKRAGLFDDAAPGASPAAAAS